MKKTIFKSFISGLVFFGTWFLLFFLIKAWDSTNSWTSDTNIFSAAGDKITSAKWNALAKKATRQDVPTSDTNPFDYTCERRIRLDSGPSCGQLQRRYPTYALANGHLQIYASSARDIDPANKTKFCQTSNCASVYCNVWAIQKRCQ